METTVTVKHLDLRVNSSFENFTKTLELLLHRLDPEIANEVLTDPGAVSEKLAAIEGELGLIIFNIRNHGAMLNIFAVPRKAKQYVIGNPLIAITMTRHDIRSAQYAPLVVLVYEDGSGRANVAYDLPSSLFSQFNNKEVDAVAKSLDEKLKMLVQIADKGVLEQALV
jgi:uncharacterized protein (DUF302 family)